MDDRDWIDRFTFILIAFAVMMFLMLMGSLLWATGFMDINFDLIDSKIIGQSVEDVPQTNAKNYLISDIKCDGAGKIDINNATAKELEALPEIGEKRALAIVEQRTKMGGFTTLRDIVCTEGIGAKTFKTIKPYIKITQYSGKE